MLALKGHIAAFEGHAEGDRDGELVVVRAAEGRANRPYGLHEAEAGGFPGTAQLY